MGRAYMRATPANKHTRRLFKAVGAGILVAALVAFSVASTLHVCFLFTTLFSPLVSSFSQPQTSKQKSAEEAAVRANTAAADIAAAAEAGVETDSFDFSSYDTSKCDDGFPEGVHLTTAQKCYFVTHVCPTDRLIDYLGFRYCTLGDDTAAVVFGTALLVVWLVALFYILGEAAESHFCPMLSEISSALRMSPDLAGMSILAFGNGAPDVFSSIAAFQQNNVDVLIGSMLGAGAFITHLIVGAIGVTANARLGRYPFVRDLVCYLLGLAFVLVLLIDGQLHLWESILFLVFYVCYIGVAVVVHIVEVRRGHAAVVTKGKRPADSTATAPLLQHQEARDTDPDADEAARRDVIRALRVPSSTPDVSAAAAADAAPRRARACSVHVSTLAEAPDDATTEATTATTTTTTAAADKGSGRTGRTLERSSGSLRGRSSSPSVRLSDAEAAALRQHLVRTRDQQEQDSSDDDDDDEDVPELALPSTAYSVQGDHEQAKSPVRSPAKKPAAQGRRGRELRALSGLRAAASRAAEDFVVRVEVAPQRRRYDNIDELRERERHLFRNGLMNVVQGWKEGSGNGDADAAATPAEEGAAQPLMVRRRSLLERFKDYVEWDEMGLFGKGMFLVMLPFSLAMHATVPHPEEEAYNKWALALSTALSPLPIFWALDLFGARVGPVPVVVLALVVSLAAGGAVAAFARPAGLPRWLQFVFIFYSFVVSMMWIYYSADEVVALLQALSTMFGLSPTIMGLTVLSWGNCVGDFVADMTVSRQGYPEMGIAATYGGPLFNLLIGMGVGGTMMCIRENPIPCPLDNMMLVGFIYLLAALVVSLVIIPLNRFTVDKRIGAVLLVGYLVFMTLSFLVEFKVLHILPHHSLLSSSSSLSSIFSSSASL